MRYIVKKLIENLRSDKYKQGKNVLHSIDRKEYCCLGVACETYFDEMMSIDIGETKLGIHGNIATYDGYHTQLPNEVQKVFGFRSRYGSHISGYTDLALTSLNDDGKTFKQIADILEENYEDYSDA